MNQMEYFTTAEQEKELALIYKYWIKKKQEELDAEEERTRKIQKFTAKGHIQKPPRVFCVQDGNVYFQEVAPENLCPSVLGKDGEKYCLDDDFKDKINDFIQRHSNYKVIFFPSGKYGPTVDYFAKKHVFPARLEADGDILEVEDDDKYDICVG